MNTDNNENTQINIDGINYDMGTLSDTVKNIVGFIQRVDLELKELKFQSDKAILARKQALIDLKSEMEG
jgi:hypothetical protein